MQNFENCFAPELFCVLRFFFLLNFKEAKSFALVGTEGQMGLKKNHRQNVKNGTKIAFKAFN